MHNTLMEVVQGFSLISLALCPLIFNIAISVLTSIFCSKIFVFLCVLFQVSMMEDGGTAARIIKQEIDSCCSPSPTSSNNNVSIISFGSSGQEPVN